MARKLRRELPEPKNISDARAGLCKPELDQFLKNNFTEIGDRKNFIEFLDQYLQEFGKGIAFVNDHYARENQRINPNLFVTDNSNFSAISSAPCGYGEPALDMAEGRYLKSFCLTAYNAPEDAHGIIMPIDRLYDLWQKKEAEDFKAEGIAAGAHEALHIRDRIYDPLHSKRQKDSAGLQDRENTPNEIRARRMEQLALRYYGYSKDTVITP